MTNQYNQENTTVNKVLITGVNGQDGSYLAELLTARGYDVVGLYRRSSTDTLGRLPTAIKEQIRLVEGDVSDYSSISGILNEYKPHWIFNTAAQSHVKTSFDQPAATLRTNTEGVINLLECIRQYLPSARLVQCSTSEMFGNNYDVAADGTKYQDENTPLKPASPYGVSKLASHELISVYRKAYGLHLSSAITYNHESPRRGDQFVTQKIAKYVAGLVKWMDKHSIKLDQLRFDEAMITSVKDNWVYTSEYLQLGNLDASRDWGHARDYCGAFIEMIQQEQPDDYVICTEETHTVREFLEAAFGYYGLDYNQFVRINPQFYRPLDVEYLRGSSKKIRQKLNWKPTTTFKQLVEEMVCA